MPRNVPRMETFTFTQISPQGTVQIKQLPITENYIANFNKLAWCTVVNLPFCSLFAVHGIVVDRGAFTTFEATFRGGRGSI